MPSIYGSLLVLVTVHTNYKSWSCYSNNHALYLKNRSMGSVLTWPGITIVENVVFQEILALTKV